MSLIVALLIVWVVLLTVVITRIYDLVVASIDTTPTVMKYRVDKTKKSLFIMQAVSFVFSVFVAYVLVVAVFSS